MLRALGAGGGGWASCVLPLLIRLAFISRHICLLSSVEIQCRYRQKLVLAALGLAGHSLTSLSLFICIFRSPPRRRVATAHRSTAGAHESADITTG